MSEERDPSYTEVSPAEAVLGRIGFGQFAFESFDYHGQQITVDDYVRGGNAQAVATFERFMAMPDDDPLFDALSHGIRQATIQMLGLTQNSDGEWVRGANSPD